MKSQDSRIEDLENKNPSDKVVVVVMQDVEDENIYHYGGETMTLQEAEERFADCDLLVVKYAKDWRNADERGKGEY